MKAAAEARKSISLARSLLCCGISKTAWYYTKRPRNVATDHLMETKIMEIAGKRPTYGTRRMAAQLARQSGLPVNWKKASQNIPKTGPEYARKAQIGDNPLKQEGSQTDCPKPVLGG